MKLIKILYKYNYIFIHIKYYDRCYIFKFYFLKYDNFLLKFFNLKN